MITKIKTIVLIYGSNNTKNVNNKTRSTSPFTNILCMLYNINIILIVYEICQLVVQDFHS
jgi:hypothetical protein